MSACVMLVFFGCYGRPLGLFDFAEILTDEAGSLRNRFFFCRCMVAMNAEEIYRFEVGVLK